MKRLIRASKDDYIHIVENGWAAFLRRLEKETGLEVDSAYKRRHEGDDTLELLDEFGNVFEATYNKYSNGDFEFFGYNLEMI